MSNNSFDQLEDAVAFIKNEPSLAGPGLAIIDQTLDRIKHIDKSRPSIYRPLYALAASVVLALGAIVLICLLLLPAKTEITWGDVIATVNEAHTMTCRLKIRSVPADRPSAAHTDVGKIMIKSPGLRREEQTGSIIITNWPARKRLTLNTEKKIATISDLTGAMPKETSPIQTFDELKNLKDAQPLGQRTVDGAAQVGFHFHQDSQPTGMAARYPATMVHYANDIWADAKTHRILQCIIDADICTFNMRNVHFDSQHRLTIDNMQLDKIHIVMDDMQWNVPLDDSLFSTAPPPGYKIVRSVQARDVTIN